jgi:hypothetical protein
VAFVKYHCLVCVLRINIVVIFVIDRLGLGKYDAGGLVAIMMVED